MAIDTVFIDGLVVNDLCASLGPPFQPTDIQLPGLMSVLDVIDKGLLGPALGKALLASHPEFSFSIQLPTEFQESSVRTDGHVLEEPYQHVIGQTEQLFRLEPLSQF